MNAEFITTCERLLSATVNGVYQGVLVALLAGLALRLFPRTNAATRYAVWFGVLLFVAALIPAHFFLSARPRVAHLPRPEPPAMTAAATADQRVFDAEITDPAPDQSQFIGSGIDSERDKSASKEPASSRPPVWNFQAGLSLPSSVCVGLVFIWVLLASVRGVLVGRRIDKVRLAKKTSIAPSQRLLTLFDRLREPQAPRRRARLRVSSAHRTAVVLGFFHPVILMPAETEQDSNDSEIEHVLRHELAHVDRRDDWGNLAQQLIQAALFFHPAVWWISARLSLEREIACDDHVLEASGGPRAYALTLANIASRINQCRALLAPGVSNNSSQLQQRITMILNTQRDRSPRLARRRLGLFATATAALAVLAIGAGPRLVLAQSPTPVADVPIVTTDAPLPPDASGPDSAPKDKPPLQVIDSVAPAPPAPDAPPAPPEAPTLTMTPNFVVAVSPAVDVTAPNASTPPLPRHGPKRQMSVEERLDRLERMLDRLESRRDVRSYAYSSGGYGASGGGGGQGSSSSADVDYGAISKFAGQQAKMAMEQVQRAQQAQAAVAQAERAAAAGQRAADRAMRDMEKFNSEADASAQKDMTQGKYDGSDKELEALRGARQALQEQVKNIEKQIRRLEDNRRREKADGQPGAPQAPSPQKAP